MTKNELPLIEDWIKYHGHLFSFENLFIIDGSTDQQVLNIYQKYENSGINVITTNANLNRLATEITSIMHRHKGRNSFLIKLDTDEFLAYRKSDDGGEFANHDITSILNSLPVTGQNIRPHTPPDRCLRHRALRVPAPNSQPLQHLHKQRKKAFSTAIVLSQSIWAVIGAKRATTRDLSLPL